MLTRRTATALLTGASIAPLPTAAATNSTAAVFYNAVGPNLTWWRPDVDNASLSRQDSRALPALIQYAWRNPARPVFYVASSNFAPMGDPAGKHHLTALRVDFKFLIDDALPADLDHVCVRQDSKVRRRVRLRLKVGVGKRSLHQKRFELRRGAGHGILPLAA